MMSNREPGNNKKFTNNDFQGDLENVKKKLHETKEAISDAAKSAKLRTGEAIEQSARDFKEKTEDIQEAVINYVKEKPMKALGIALLTGVVLSKIFHK
jgi:ElaB/YqjD/DUF883 family membrane-anchored ribosome-binding protein